MNPPLPLTIAVLAKQVPRNEEIKLQSDGRLQRDGVEMEMDAYSRRAVAKGIELARSSGGRCVVFSMGPPSAIDVLRESIAVGADRGFLLSDPALRGSDTLATARALVSAMRLVGPFDLILLGRSSVDAETAQLGPEIAQMLGLPFASAVKSMELKDEKVYVNCEVDYGHLDVVMDIPCVLGVAERLCSPAKAERTTWDAVPSERIEIITADLLGEGPWGEEGSPTRVTVTVPLSIQRECTILHGPPDEQVTRAIETIAKWNLSSSNNSEDKSGSSSRSRERARLASSNNSGIWKESSRSPQTNLRSFLLASGEELGKGASNASRPIAIIFEPDRPQLGEELLALAAFLSASVTQPNIKAILPYPSNFSLPRYDRSYEVESRETLQASSQDPYIHYKVQLDGEERERWTTKLGVRSPATLDLINELAIFEGSDLPVDLVAPVSKWITDNHPWLMLAPSTSWGREITGRLAAELRIGLIADAVGLDLYDGEGLIAWKPALGGLVKVGIVSASPIQVVTVRPGSTGISSKSSVDREWVSDQDDRVHSELDIRVERVVSQGKTAILQRTHEDDPELLHQARFVVGIGQGVEPDGYEEIRAFAESIGASLAATRKVTDKGLLPRSRQVGITGTSILAKLYLAIGISGKPSHLAGCSGVDHIIAINSDPNADVFKVADLGLVGDWRHIVPKLRETLPRALSQWRTT